MKPTLAVLVLALAASAQGTDRPFTVVEATLPELQAALRSGRITSRALVLEYLARIATYEDRLNAAITVNPRALAEADALDRERAQGKIRGPLHGIPIALKDNIHTTDLPTTGGALAFAGFVPPFEATVTKNLRDAGAIIIAKTQMTELANWVAASPQMPNNYNALHGWVNRLDALLFPGPFGANIAARAGYPTVTVPFGLVPNAPTPPFPDGFDAKPAPFGVSFTGMACSEPTLLKVAYAFEQATKRRVRPPDMP